LLQVLQQANTPPSWQHLCHQVQSLEQRPERKFQKELKTSCLVVWIFGLMTVQAIL